MFSGRLSLTASLMCLLLPISFVTAAEKSSRILLEKGGVPTLVTWINGGDTDIVVKEFSGVKLERSDDPIKTSVAFNVVIEIGTMEQLMSLCNNDVDRNRFRKLYEKIIGSEKGRAASIKYLSMVNVGGYSILFYVVNIDGSQVGNYDCLVRSADGRYGLSSDVKIGNAVLSFCGAGRAAAVAGFSPVSSVTCVNGQCDVAPFSPLTIDVYVKVSGEKNIKIGGYTGGDEIYAFLNRAWREISSDKALGMAKYWRPVRGGRDVDGEVEFLLADAEWQSEQLVALGYVSYDFGVVVYLKKVGVEGWEPVYINIDGNGAMTFSDGVGGGLNSNIDDVLSSEVFVKMVESVLRR